jgi:hypothetical protein
MNPVGSGPPAGGLVTTPDVRGWASDQALNSDASLTDRERTVAAFEVTF